MIKNWVLEVPLTNARWASSRVIRGGAFDGQVQWLMMSKVMKERVTPYLFWKSILIRRCLRVMVFINKISFMQNSHKTLKASSSYSSIYNLASSSNSTSFVLFRRRTSLTSKVGSLWMSTSSLGFPGGSLGHLRDSWHWECLSVGLLGHNSDLVV